ncbi:MAG: hypothetical protein FJW27_02115 [Acidimicrobiia bacterium]|nr:hypothetical protein [Acidimicrobiia bacterium]
MPAHQHAIDFALQEAGGSTSVVTAAAERYRVPKHPQSPTLVLDRPLAGDSVLAVVDPRANRFDPLLTAIDFAERLSAQRVVACHV